MSRADVARQSPTNAQWIVKGRVIDLNRPRILGILNVTPDSFSDGGDFFSPSAAVDHAGRLLEEGADVVDVGGESTRPQGAVEVPLREELDRVVPVIQSIAESFPSAIISIDTVKAGVAREALEAGAHIVNDVSAFRLDAAMATTCARAHAGVVLMHSRGTVLDMATYERATYGTDPVGEVIAELNQSLARARGSGVAGESIVLDPGIGFAKRAPESLKMLRYLDRFVALGYPVMVGVSRKRFVGELSGVPVARERVFGSIGGSVMALAAGAILFRVHDVLATRQALDVAWGIMTEGET